MIPPRWGTARNPSRESRLAEAERVAAAFGFELFEWQRHCFDVATEIDPDTGRPCFKVAGLLVGRQNGKTAASAIRIGMELMHPGRHVSMTAQDRNMAKSKWLELVELLEGSDLPVKRIWRGSGQERVVMENGSTFSIFTPSDRGVRGLSLDLTILDEAMAHDYGLLAAIQPTMATKPNAQMWLLSNVGNEHSTLLAHHRQLAHELVAEPDAPNPSRLCWFEWAPHEDRFDPTDPEVWRQAIPTLDEELGVTLEAVEQACASLPPDLFAAEMLNCWPAIAASAVIDPEKWAAAATTVQLPPAGIVFGLDVSVDRDAAAIVACGMSQGRYIVEVVEARESVGWVHDRLVELTRQHRASVVIDGGTAAAGAFIAGLEQEQVTVISAKLRDYANACSLFYDAVEEGTIGHGGDYRLTDVVTVAGRRKVGDAWLWARRAGLDTTPLVAATLAHWAAVTVRAPVPAIH